MNRKERKIWAAMLFILALGLSTIGVRSLGQPPLFQATALVAVERDDKDLPEVPNAAPGLNEAVFIQTEIELIQSEAVLGPVIERMDLNLAWEAKSPGGKPLTPAAIYQRLKSRVLAQPVPGTTNISIQVSSEDAAEAAALANAVAEAYGEYRAAERRRLAQPPLNAISAKLIEMQEKLGAARQHLAETGKQLESPPQTIAETTESLQAEEKAIEELRRRHAEATLRSLGLSNQLTHFLKSASTDDELARELAARVEQASAATATAEAALRKRMNHLTALRAHHAAQQDLDDIQQLMALLQETVAKLQRELDPKKLSTIKIVEPAVALETSEPRTTGHGRLFLAAGGLALGLAVVLLLFEKRPKLPA